MPRTHGASGFPQPPLLCWRLHAKRGLAMPLFGSENWLYIALIGLLVGIVARFFKPGRDRMGIILTTLLGIVGALFAGWFGQSMGWYQPGQPAGFIGAVLGSIFILLLVGLFKKPRERRIFRSRR